MPLDQAMETMINSDSAADWMRQYQTQKRVCAEENGVLRNIVKRAKADGMPIKAMIATVAASKLDPEEVQRDLRDRLRLMSIKRIEVDRDSLFDWDTAVTAQTRQADDAWTAGDKGYRAGRHGTPAEECPYEAGAPLAVAWLVDWRKGQASIARELGQNASQASASRARPQRSAQQQGDLGVAANGAAKKRTRGPGRKNGAVRAPRDKVRDSATAH
jgi:ribosome modulation factor